MEYDLIRDELIEIAEDIINANSAPGLPENYVSFITKDVQIINGVNGLSACVSVREIENAIQNNLSPMALFYGISANGIQRRTFIKDALFDKPEAILNNKEEDYELNVDILNYIYSIISAVNHLEDLKENEVMMITYCGEADITSIENFTNLSDLRKTIYEDYGIEKSNN